MSPCSRRNCLRACCALPLMLAGCNRLFKTDEPDNTTVKKLPSVPIAPDALELQIAFIQRPLDDPLANYELWQVVDQVGALDADVRRRLRTNGLRVGQVGSSAPPVLETLLTPSEDSLTADGGQMLIPRRVVLPGGGKTEIQTGAPYESCTVDVDFAPGQESHEYTNARCLFRVHARRVQEGWARLEFLPEIHHGDQQLRPQAAAGGWQLRTAQQIEPLYPLRFEVTLNVGDMVILGADGPQAASLGRHFFLDPNPDAHLQRLLVVRLAHMEPGDAR